MKIEEFEFLEGREPRFEIGQKVFVLVGGNEGYHEDTITDVCFEMHEYPYIKTTGYRTSSSDIFRDNGIFATRDVTEDENLAKHEMEFTKVSIDERIWQQAIGDRSFDPDYNNPRPSDTDDGEKVTIEDSELGVCCSTISSIRDILLECKENGGLNRRQINELANLLGSHEPSLDQRYLSRIFKDLGLVWDEVEGD